MSFQNFVIAEAKSKSWADATIGTISATARMPKNLRYCFDNIITFPNGKTMEDIVAAEKKQQSNTEEKQQNNTEAPNKQSKQTNDKSTKTTNVDNGSGTISSDGKTLTEKDGTKYKVAGKITKKQRKRMKE